MESLGKERSKNGVFSKKNKNMIFRISGISDFENCFFFHYFKITRKKKLVPFLLSFSSRKLIMSCFRLHFFCSIRIMYTCCSFKYFSWAEFLSFLNVTWFFEGVLLHLNHIGTPRCSSPNIVQVALWCTPTTINLEK